MSTRFELAPSVEMRTLAFPSTVGKGKKLSNEFRKIQKLTASGSTLFIFPLRKFRLRKNLFVQSLPVSLWLCWHKEPDVMRGSLSSVLASTGVKGDERTRQGTREPP